jgi:hypothetical protein
VFRPSNSPFPFVSQKIDQHAVLQIHAEAR